MKVFICEPCNYNSNDKKNYNRHLQSKKHKKIVGRFRINRTDIKEECDNKNKQEMFTCDFCGKNYTTNKSLRQHQQNYCKKKEYHLLENQLNDLKKILSNSGLNKLAENQIELQKKINEKDKIIEEQHKTVKNILIEGTKQMKDNNKKIYHMSMKNQNSYKFILEHFQDAPDAFFPKDIEEQLFLNMEKYMDMDNPVAAISKAFHPKGRFYSKATPGKAFYSWHRYFSG